MNDFLKILLSVLRQLKWYACPKPVQSISTQEFNIIEDILTDLGMFTYNALYQAEQTRQLHSLCNPASISVIVGRLHFSRNFCSKIFLRKIFGAIPLLCAECIVVLRS